VAHASVCDVGEMHNSATGRVSEASGESLELEKMGDVGGVGGGCIGRLRSGNGDGVSMYVCMCLAVVPKEWFDPEVDKAGESADGDNVQTCLCIERESE
jgi:hypothetical protein